MAKRRPKSADESTLIPEPFAASAIVHGERVFVAEDKRHDEAVKKAKRIGGVAVEGAWVSAAMVDAFIAAWDEADNVKGGEQAALYQLLSATRELKHGLVAARTVLESK